MIPRFDTSTALLLIDVQKGVDDTSYYGGPTGRVNNPEAKTNIRNILQAWREKGGVVAFTRHDSIEDGSPLKLSLKSGQQLDGMDIRSGDIAVSKSVNSGFIGTSLELDLRRANIQRLCVVGFFTNVCVETTVRMAGNMGFDTYLVHNMAVAGLNGEFCTAISTQDALGLLEKDATHLDRVQGNE